MKEFSSFYKPAPKATRSLKKKKKKKKKTVHTGT